MIGKKAIQLANNEPGWRVLGYAVAELLEKGDAGTSLYLISIYGNIERTGIPFTVENKEAFSKLVRNVVPDGYRPTLVDNKPVRQNKADWPAGNDNPRGTMGKGWLLNIADTGDIWFRPLASFMPSAGVIDTNDMFDISCSYICDQSDINSLYRYRMEGDVWLQ